MRDNHDGRDLRSLDFVKVPGFVESIFDLENGVDADLRVRVGRKRHKDLLRLVRKANSEYTTTFYDLSTIAVAPDILSTVGSLHELNIRKYSHARNTFSPSILARLCASSLGPNLLLCVRRDRSTGVAVQASISIIDRAAQQMFQLVQGIDHSVVRPGHNLYVVDYYDLYQFAEAKQYPAKSV